MTPMERYRSDPYFHQIVDMFIRQFETSTGSGAGITPTEVRDAAGLAWQIYYERHSSPMIPITRREFG